MKRPLAFALSGGGSRGALQVGALRALLEAGIRPDILVGTSAGAVNATFLALRGVSLATIDALVDAWHDAAAADLIPPKYLWLTVRMLFNRPGHIRPNMRDFFVAHGLSPERRFADIQGVRLILVAADLNGACCALYGIDQQQSVLEGLVASTAIPPWVQPLETQGRLLMDGGAVSSLPVEPALARGAAEIIALDVADPRDAAPASHGFGPFMSKMMNTVQRRQTELELSLAAARHVPVRQIALRGRVCAPAWDFRHVDELVAEGYESTRREMAKWPDLQPKRWRSWLDRLPGPGSLRWPGRGRDKSAAGEHALPAEPEPAPNSRPDDGL